MSNKAPKAKQIPKVLKHLGHERVDPYFWMNQRDDEAVLAHLKAENAFTESILEPVKELRTSLFEEMKARIVEDDQSVPYNFKDYSYYHRYVKGGEYPIFCRKSRRKDGDEEVLLDGNQLAEGLDYFQIGRRTISEDQRLLAYAFDTLGRRIHTIRIRDLNTGEILSDEIQQSSGAMAWAKDGKTLFYVKMDEQTLRPFQLYKHTLGQPQEDDVLIYQEEDETFWMTVRRSRTRQHLFMDLFSTMTSESRYLPADENDGRWRVFQERKRGRLYSVDDHEHRFFINTNDDAVNFKMMWTPIDNTSFDAWQPILGHRLEVYLEDYLILKEFLVMLQRERGLHQLVVYDYEGREQHRIRFEEPTYSLGFGTNLEFDTDEFRFFYDSLTTPESVYDYHIPTREKTLLKRKTILGGYDRDNYKAERIEAKADDGTLIPISIVYRKDLKQNGPQELLLYGYGSYGISADPYFSPSRLSLLDRGFIFAETHIRGGADMGRPWYEDGKLLNKQNTFNDFIACAEHLINEGYTDPERMCALGGSAGGLLMGAVINKRPDLFKAVVAAVPFVDVLTTMLDTNIPLTTGEYDEWGNPNVHEFYEYMASYSPYDNIRTQNYPMMLVPSGYHDSQVQYWEPAKWVAKLRDHHTGDQPILLHMNMDAGHSGASGRFKVFEEIALQYAFMLWAVGKTQSEAKT